MKNSLSLVLVLSLVILLCHACRNYNSAKLNLDFEMVDSRTGKHSGWQIDNDQNYNIGFDSKIVHSGKYALKIENIDKFSSEEAVKMVFLIIDNPHSKKHIKLTGFIKTEGTNSDSLGLFISFPDGSKQACYISKSKNFTGTHDWQQYSVEVFLERELDRFLIGAGLIGTGKVWIDDLKLYVNDSELKYNFTSDINLDGTRIKWLKKNCTRIKTVKAENGFDDLQDLKKMIGNSRIVGLGENTHGTSEVFKMKHRLIEFLATEMGFTIFSIEANMPEAYKLNEYVLNGKGDPKALLKGMYFWTWNTREVLDMIEWMRKFNSSGKGKIQFTGFDMQFIFGALDNISKFAENHNPVLKSKLDSISFLFKRIEPKNPEYFRGSKEIKIIRQKCEEVAGILRKNKTSISKVAGEYGYNWLVQNSVIMTESVDLWLINESSFRDKCMAQNISWILENNPDSRIVLWAHNFHISRESITMGGFLAEKYGDQYFNIGFLSNSGTYTAWNYKKLSSENVLPASEPGSIEYSFHQTGIESFLFDFAKAKSNAPESQWLLDSIRSQETGALALQNSQFLSSKLSKKFNSVIFIDSTHASHCFDVH